MVTDLKSNRTTVTSTNFHYSMYSCTLRFLKDSYQELRYHLTNILQLQNDDEVNRRFCAIGQHA